MPKKPKITQEEIDVFQKAVQGTKPLIQGKVRLDTGVPKKARAPVVFEDEISFFDGGEPREDIQADDFIEYKGNGVSHKTLRKLMKAQYNVDASLDLHRKTVEQARTEVNQFLYTCLQKGIKCALIVHGKGKPGAVPVLKNHLNYWLRQVEQVIAFCSALPHHGGKGAVYVLLRRLTEEKQD
jgi:DNA-nicking Smr family endonuclease